MTGSTLLVTARTTHQGRRSTKGRNRKGKKPAQVSRLLHVRHPGGESGAERRNDVCGRNRPCLHCRQVTTVKSGLASGNPILRHLLLQSFGAFESKCTSVGRPGQPTVQRRHLLHLPVSSTARQLSQPSQRQLRLPERKPLPLGRDSCC